MHENVSKLELECLSELGDRLDKTPQSRFLTGSGRNRQSRNNKAVLLAHIVTSSSACSGCNNMQ